MQEGTPSQQSFKSSKHSGPFLQAASNESEGYEHHHYNLSDEQINRVIKQAIQQINDTLKNLHTPNREQYINAVHATGKYIVDIIKHREHLYLFSALSLASIEKNPLYASAVLTEPTNTLINQGLEAPYIERQLLLDCTQPNMVLIKQHLLKLRTTYTEIQKELNQFLNPPATRVQNIVFWLAVAADISFVLYFFEQLIHDVIYP